MTRPRFRLLLALAASLLLHILPFVPGLLPTRKPPSRPPALTAELRPPPAMTAAQPELKLRERALPAAASAPPPPPPATREASRPKEAPRTWLTEVRKQFRKLDEQGLFYPREAIAQGLQGEVLVLLVLDEAGQVAAARVEQGSGHAILDAAALRAVRSLHSLPADAPRETLLPVNFRLR